MRKDQLIRALSSTRPATPPRAKKERPAPRAPKNVKRPAAASDGHAAGPARRPVGAPSAVAPAPHTLNHASQKDRIIVLARDSYWLHAHWELSRTTLARAQAALGQEWHSALPILRLIDVTSEDTTNAAERIVRDIPIHGGVNNWYIDVVKPPRSYRIDVGYLSRRGKFYVLARSNIVTTPKAGVTDALEENWASVQQQFERVQNPSTINAHKSVSSTSVDLNDLFDERLRRPLSSLSMQNLSLGALPGLGRRFHFEIDAELIVYGTTEPNAQVTLQGEPVQLRPDGTFTVRFSLPDSRQIIPAVAASADGVEERTVVLAVERNTKELEPMIHDSNEL
ncbi:DUF4912 domain-containing protein [Paludisphaera mucosa]|uniref:DUF4912 domain-containing protein n=1 Tax=Paludisphaera mucosa TaxID=3030827 RepID=A0ABT6FG87_9BACT|nr:DUF4912 domain-containing protein [Paludisphaera mucosa]MDG3006582.1 DUF4912 domain-containing protein [Paludisphaera mucosa]